jgi:hypothetical protein
MIRMTDERQLFRVLRRIAESYLQKRLQPVSALSRNGLSLRDSSGKPAQRRRVNTPKQTFGQKWAGKLRLRTPSTPDPLLDALKARYGLSDK